MPTHRAMSRRQWLKAISQRCLPAASLLAGVSLFPRNGWSQQAGKAIKAAPGAGTGTATTAKWEVLYLPPRQRKTGVQPLPEASSLKLIKTLDLAGPAKGHPHLLGQFAINGEFGIAGGLLTRVTGANAAIEVAEAENFELEGMIQAEGTGGWFILVGWKDGTGHALFQIGTRTSGCPWFHCYFKEGVADKDSHVEFGRIEWKGPQPLALSVNDKAVTLKVGTSKLANQLALRDYTPGGILIGTYDTQYGPRNVQIQSLRIKKIAGD